MKTRDILNKLRINSMRHLAVILCLVTILVWVILFFVQLYVFNNGQFDASDLINNILGNLLGILPPIIIFNFAYEYLTKKAVSKDISDHIAETIMADSKVLKSFSYDAQEKFLESTLRAMIGKDKSKIALSMLSPYVDQVDNSRFSDFGIRKNMNYEIKVNSQTEEILKNISFISDSSDYILLTESLSYSKPNVKLDFSEKCHKFKIAFCVDNQDLEDKLKNDDYLMRENLKLKEEDFQKLINMSKDELEKCIIQTFLFKININDIEAVLENIEISKSGFSLIYQVNMHNLQNKNSDDLSVDIFFKFPQLRSVHDFQAVVSEPTYCPCIKFTWDKGFKNVQPITYFSGNFNVKGEKYFENQFEYKGEDWIFPVSGVTFTWD
ncbi:MAG: hypothetical protein LBM13_02160 [Candidatus Ancillula sp.]|nr:hypothetical protein [Candidatus Ancillula sp.]